MELIDKRAAYEALKHEAEMHELPFTREAYERAARIIDKMYVYTIELNVRNGTWLTKINDFHNGYNLQYAECSVCGHTESIGIAPRMRYCPHCGARMDGDEE